MGETLSTGVSTASDEPVLGFEAIDRTHVALVGGKGANLGELSRIDGVRVPPGVCVTTGAFRRVMADAPSIDDRLHRLSHVTPDDREAIGTVSAEIRKTIEDKAIPDDLAAAITGQLSRLGEHAAYAVRSSATAEDLPTTSFAGQQDTYLNVVGIAAILQHISRCWASLFTERAVTYRQRNGFEHRSVHMAVVVQQMAFPDVAGIMFTADPVTSNRKIISIDAGYGLGEALVSGLVNPDAYRVREGAIIDTTIGAKQRAIVALPGGGTQELAIEPARQNQPALTDAQVVKLADLGRRIEAHFGCPQDIEWCLVDDDFWIVQSRPITTLFPLPEVDDDDHHVYVSVGHQQMMTDPIKPLGLSVWQLTTPAPMREAGGRLFVDVAPRLASPATRANIVEALGKSDPLIGDALETVVDRGFIALLPDEGPGEPLIGAAPPGGAPVPLEADPAVVTDLIETTQASIAAMKCDIATRSGSELLDFIVADIGELKQLLFHPRSMPVIMAAMEATWWLNDRLYEWLDEKNAADTLTQSVPNNVTAEMGLALLDVADVIRPHPEVVAFLRDVDDDGFLDELPKFAGGPEARDAIDAFLDKYGMRCAGEIDITRPRWRTHPTALVPVILGNIDNFEPGAGEARFEQGRGEASRKEVELLERLRTLEDGAQKAEETKAMIERVRTFAGYREYPKYGMVSRYFVYQQALLAEAERLVRANVLSEADDIVYLRIQELHDVVRTNRVDDELIDRRKVEFESYRSLTPPRVMTSEGEVITGSYQRDDVPPGALVGLPVSAGTVEGRARVVLDMAAADVGPDDILVTPYTDPSWTPLFVAIKGLVTEVGGLMTHGAVIAREYGLPAVVGVERATQLIRDGQRIRVHGTDGYIEFLP